MTYDDFERIGMDEGAPYAFCKIAWEMNRPHPDAFEKHPLYELELRAWFQEILAGCPQATLDRLRQLDASDMAPQNIEQAARAYLGRRR